MIGFKIAVVLLGWTFFAVCEILVVSAFIEVVVESGRLDNVYSTFIDYSNLLLVFSITYFGLTMWIKSLEGRK